MSMTTFISSCLCASTARVTVCWMKILWPEFYWLSQQKQDLNLKGKIIDFRIISIILQKFEVFEIESCFFVDFPASPFFKNTCQSASTLLGSILWIWAKSKQSNIGRGHPLFLLTRTSFSSTRLTKLYSSEKRKRAKLGHN